MALAILRWRNADDQYSYFDIDIGIANRYYLYKIGDGSVRRVNGLKQLATSQTGPIQLKQMPKEKLGRDTLAIPKGELCCPNDPAQRFVQLFSFRTEQLDGPALSDIVKVPREGLKTTSSFAASLESSMPQHHEQQPVEVVAFAYKELPPVDTAMALGKLSSVVGKLSKSVSPLAKTAFKQAGNFIAQPQNQQMLMNAGSAMLAGLGQGQTPNTQMLMQMLMGFLNQFGGMGQTGIPQTGIPQTGMAPTGMTPSGMPQIMPGGQSGMMPTLRQGQTPMMGTGMIPMQPSIPQRVPNSSAQNTALLAQRQLQKTQVRQGQQMPPTGLQTRPAPLSRTKTFATASSAFPAQQMALPGMALLGNGLLGGGISSLLGKSGSMLGQALAPETLQMLGQNPSSSKLLAALTEGIAQIARLNLDDKKQDQSHIEKYAKPDDVELLQANWAYQTALFTHALARSPKALEYRRVGRVRIDFTNVTTLILHGRSRVAYHQDREMAFPLQLKTPRSIGQGVLQILIKDAETLEILIEEKYLVEDLDSGPLEVVPRIDREQLAQLTPNEEYLVTVVLAWTGRSKSKQRRKRLGTSMTQMITLVGDYCFDRVEGRAKTVALSDVDRYRAYWHKVWQGQISRQRRQLLLDCKYYYALERDRTPLARMETLTRIQQVSETRQTGQLKAGMLLTPERLNALLEQIPDYEPLTNEQLDALFNTDNLQLFQALARTEVKFKGKRGDTVALWVYPEFRIQRILLKKAAQTNENGLVTELTEHPVHFPIPASAHFIGVSNE